MKFRLRTKIQLLVNALLLVIVLFVGIYFPTQTRQTLLESFTREAQALAETVALGVSIGLQNQDLQSAQRAIDYVKQNPDVRFVALVSDGQTVAAYPEKFDFASMVAVERSATNTSNDTLIIKRAAVHSETLNGTVIVGSSTKRIAATIQERTVTMISAIAGLFLLGSVGVYLLARSLTKPIIALRDAAKRIGNGDVQTPMPSLLHRTHTGSDEIGELTRSFGEMLESLLRANAEITRQTTVAHEGELRARQAQRQAVEQQEYLQRSVERMLESIQDFAKGNLNVRLHIEAFAASGTTNTATDTTTNTATRTADSVANASNDAIGSLCVGFNEAVENVQQMMRHVQAAAENVAQSAANIQERSIVLAEAAQGQSLQTQEIRASMNQMATTIADNARSAAQTATVATQNRVLAQSGGAVVSQTVEKIRQIAGIVAQSARTIEQLGNSSAEIGEITLVINEIADQTNLLALNAAIEAARAGEQGRGFAVVADEVRKLAERTTQATKQITMMISSIQRETSEAVKVMNAGTASVQQGIELADNAGAALQSVVQSSESMVELIQSIAAASEQQSAAGENVSASVARIATLSSDSANDVGVIAHAAELLSAMTTALRVAIGRFEGVAEPQHQTTLPTLKHHHAPLHLLTTSNHGGERHILQAR
jgi:methyl-accepting chemotaxis protein